MDVHVESVGQGGTGLPALLLHGFGSGSFTWGPAVAAGMVEGRAAVAFDRYGFGATARPPAGSWEVDGTNPYSLEGAVTLTGSVLEAEGWPTAVLVGHSAGALVALAYALDHPERIAGLVLVAPVVRGPPAGVTALFGLPGSRRWGPLLLRAGRPMVGRGVAMAWHDRSRLASTGLAGAYAASTSAAGWAEGLVELTAASSSEAAASVVRRLGALRPPVLVITGDHDRIVSASATSTLVSAIRDVRTVVVPACGHVPHEERPEVVVAEVRPFLAALDRSRH